MNDHLGNILKWEEAEFNKHICTSYVQKVYMYCVQETRMGLAGGW